MNERSPSSTCSPDFGLSGHTHPQKQWEHKPLYIRHTSSFWVSSYQPKTLWHCLYYIKCLHHKYWILILKLNNPFTTTLFLSSQSKNSLHSIFSFTYSRSRLVLIKGKDFVELKMKSCSTPLFLQKCKQLRTPVEAVTYISLRLLCTVLSKGQTLQPVGKVSESFP